MTERPASPVALNSFFIVNAAHTLRVAPDGCFFFFLPEMGQELDEAGRRGLNVHAHAVVQKWVCLYARCLTFPPRLASPLPTPSRPDPLSFPRSSLPL